MGRLRKSQVIIPRSPTLRKKWRRDNGVEPLGGPITAKDLPPSVFEDIALTDPELYRVLIEKRAAELSLSAFTELMWPYVEPSNPYVPGWHINAICEHLEAVSYGKITRLLINIPPGTMKSILTDVMFPAWEWIKFPSYRYVCTSYSHNLTERDNVRFRQVIMSDVYRAMWGESFKLTRDSMSKMENDKTGWKLATSTGGVGTGERGDRVLIDDPHNAKDGESDAVRNSTLQYFTEVLPTRLTNPISSAMIVIMQRLHEEDVSGLILSRELGYEHLCLPMEFEPDRKCYTSIGFEDPRTEPGELLFPARFPAFVVEREKKVMGPFSSASQFQQSPVPRGGGIIKRKWWKLWPEEGETFGADGAPVKGLAYPPMEFIIGSVDTAHTAKKENDYCALAVLGVWRNKERLPKIMLMHAWRKRLEFRGDVLHRMEGEEEADYRRRRMKAWGLLEWVLHDCRRLDVDRLLIEDKAVGHTLSQEIKKVYADEKFGTDLVTPRGDKVSRTHAVQHLWAEGMMYAPERAWAEVAIQEMEFFPKAKHDDLHDAITQGVAWLRNSGWALRRDELKAEDEERGKYKAKPKILYDV